MKLNLMTDKSTGCRTKVRKNELLLVRRKGWTCV